MPEEYEEGIGLLNNSPPRNQFVPDYSFSALGSPNLYESTEMLPPIQPKVETDSFSRRRLSIKSKPSWKSLFNRKKENLGPRIIQINQPEINQGFLVNSVSTAKYNLATFLPKFLYEEFSKTANIFFLFISGIQVTFVLSFFCSLDLKLTSIQQIPNISPTSRYTTVAPLIVVLLITAIKEIIEDFVRFALFLCDNRNTDIDIGSA